MNKTKKFSYDGRSRIPTETYKREYNRIFNPTLTKNMPNVKWKEIPPVRGPNPQGETNGGTIRRSDKQMVTSQKISKKNI